MGPSGSFGEVPRGTAPPTGVKRLIVLLIKPSKYDDDGYVMRYARGVLPSNTLAALAGLTEEVAEKHALGPLAIRVRRLDEHVQKIDVRQLARRFPRADLDAYWEQLRDRLRRGRVLGINPLRLAWNAARDARLCLRFNVSFLASLAREAF